MQQVDVTEVVVAERQLQSTHDQLAEEKQRMDVLIKRQLELIACLGKISGADEPPTSLSLSDMNSDTAASSGPLSPRPGSSQGGRSNRLESQRLLHSVRQRLAEGSASTREAIELRELLGQGTVRRGSENT